MTKRIAVGIPTFKRPQGLRRTLTSIANLQTTLDVQVIVAENDAQGSAGAHACAAVIAEGYRWPLQVVTSERGISEARNAIMDTAFKDDDIVAVAMVDDDQWVESNWLDALAEMRRRTGATVVGGYTRPDFEGVEEPWAKDLPVYWQPKGPDGPCGPSFGSGGILLSRTALAYCTFPYFDPEFSLTGGGDVEFFTRLAKRGATLAFAGSAVAHEVTERSRLTKAWARHRAYRIGATDMRILLLHSGAWWNVTMEIIKIAAAFVVGPAHYALFVFVPHRRMLAELKMHRALGKLATLFGHRYNEYANTHGN